MGCNARHRRKGVGLRCLSAWLMLISMVVVPVRAQTLEPDEDFNKGARTSLQFLKIGLGARQAAIGEASIASVRDVNAIFWNPGNLTGVDQLEASFSYTRWLADLNYVSGALAYSVGTLGTIGVSVASLDYGEIQEALAVSATGSNDTRTGNTVSGGDLMASLAFARAFTDRLSIGINAKYVREELFEFSASTFAWDVGTNYDLGYKGVRLAMSVQNFGGSIQFLEQGSQTEAFDVPIVFRIGLSMNLISPDGNALMNVGAMHRMQIALEAINTNDFNERLHVGGEYFFGEFLALRGGYRMNYAEGNLALGFGLSPTISDLTVRIDYAYVDYEFLNAPHRLSLTLAL